MDASKFDCTKEQSALGLDILKCVKMDADSMFGGMQFQCPSDAPKCAACAKHVDKSFASDCKLSCTVFPLVPVSIAVVVVVLLAIAIFCYCRRKNAAPAAAAGGDG